MLKLPENVVGTDFKQHRIAATDQGLIAEYENLVTDWMTTIEAILNDTTDERC
jgi:dynein heavy chain